jgi:hypothetical protein
MGSGITRLVRSTAQRLAAVAIRFANRAGEGTAKDGGMTTAEYAVGTLAACGLAAVLYKVVTSGAVSGELQQLIERALDAKF